MPETQTSRNSPRGFPNTRWSVVLAARRTASPESADALETLCRAYWYPLYTYVRRSGHSPHDAQDLTQEFFCRLIEKRWLDTADREKGRLRTFLISALKRFMVSEWRRASAKRRGGGQEHVPMDTQFAESRYAADTNVALGPDDAFDRQWAITLNNLTLERLEQEFATAGKEGDFEVLKECLVAARGTIDYRSIGAKLDVAEGAARVAVHRLRKRFREIYREEISRTLADDANLEAELHHLAQALARA